MRARAPTRFSVHDSAIRAISCMRDDWFDRGRNRRIASTNRQLLDPRCFVRSLRPASSRLPRVKGREGDPRVHPRKVAVPTHQPARHRAWSRRSSPAPTSRTSSTKLRCRPGRSRSNVTTADFDRRRQGSDVLRRRSLVLSEGESRERASRAGHSVVAARTAHADPLHMSRSSRRPLWA